MKRVFVALLFAVSLSAFSDELISVPSTDAGFFANSSPTNTMLWDTPNTKGVVVLFPGGDGSFNLNRVWRRPYQTRMNKSIVELSDPTKTTGNMSAAFVDSPYPLGMDHYPSARFSSTHINRVISALDAIREKTNNKPLWLYGHSNGSITVFEVYAELQKQKRDNMIAGLIVSGPRDVINIPNKVNVPVLFIHHKRDACFDTTLSDAQRNFEKITKITTARASMEILDGPAYNMGHPCLTGNHMFEGMYDELAQTMDKFINQ